MKKSTKITLIIVVILLVILLGWFFFFRGGNGGAGSPISNLFPFWGPNSGGSSTPNSGDTATSTNPTTASSTSPEEYAPGSELPLLFKLHNTAVSGLTPFVNEAGGISARYIERALGHVYERDMATLSESKITNETYNAVYEGVWVENGETVEIRKDDNVGNITTYALNIPVSGDKASGSYLDKNIISIASETGGSRIFSLEHTGHGVVGVVSNPDGSSKHQIYSSPLSEWTASWPTKNIIAIASKPAYGIPGYLYFVNPSSGALRPILSEIDGLTALVSPDGKKVLYDESTDRGTSSHIYDIASGEKTDISLPIYPDKCVWKDNITLYCATPASPPDGNYPDDWYQGVMSFSDAIWKINIDSGIQTQAINPIEDDGSTMDIMNMSIDPQNTALFFINKNDLTPWRLLISN